MTRSPLRALMICLGFLVAGELRAEPLTADGTISETERAVLVASEQGRRGVRTWALGAGLKTLGGGMLWVRQVRPPASLAVQKGLKMSSGLFILTGVVMVHTGAIMEWMGTGSAVRVLEDAGRAPEVDRTSAGWWLYLGSIGLPPLRPVSVFLGYQQLEELEAASIHFPK